MPRFNAASSAVIAGRLIFGTPSLMGALGIMYQREQNKNTLAVYVDKGVSINRDNAAYSLLFTSSAFNSPNAWVSRFTKVSSPLRNHTRGS